MLHDGGNFALGHGFSLLELVVKLPAGADLQNDVNIALVVEVAVHFDDVGVVEVHLDFELSYKLLGDLLFLEESLF